MRLLPRCKTLILALACLAGAAALPAAAQDTYPSKPIHLILPFPPGGPTDTVSRALGERLGRAWKVPVVVENRPGGNSFIATEMVAKAAPDGYSLMVAFRSEEHTSELQSLMRNSYADLCLKKKKTN